jgi:rfaE bifunctional protein nucleotidyltransferase chain/domain
MAVDPRSKVKSIHELKLLVREAQSRGLRVVFTNGCFDLLHVGHIRYLQAARALGDLLVLAINSDASVRAGKGRGRPIQCQEDRAEILTSLECVDYLVVFDAPTVDMLLLDVKPDIHAKGTDYTVETVPERETVLSYGGEIAIAGDPKDHSTRNLIRAVLSSFRL